MPPHPRSSVACQNCRLRKVRCSFATSGMPCANCQYDKVTCDVLPRRKNGAKRKHVFCADEALRVVESEPSQNPLPPNDRSMEATPWTGSLGMALGLTSTSSGSNPSTRRDTAPETSVMPQGQPVAGDCIDYFIAKIGQTPVGNRALLYTGDQQAINGMVLDLSDGRPKSSCYRASRTSKRFHNPEDLEFLRIKGCFSLPSQAIRQELVLCYFQLVHPFLPIINAAHFLDGFVNRRDFNTSLLVLWSIFFAAASFVDAKTLQEAGYKSRKEMKQAMYQRAKYLFDNDFEEDKVAVVQSAVLLAFFYTDTEDRSGAWRAWHWTGTAISLCQTMGLHRDLEAITAKNHFTQDQLHLFRRIWWSCFVRDRWLSLSHGWPMRIQLDYCDTPMPTIEDVIMDLKDVPSSIVEKYLSADQNALATLWINFVRLSKVLGNMIQTFYSLQRSLPDIEDVKRCENEILQCDSSGAENDDADAIAVFHTYDLKMFREAAIIVLYRPYIQQRTYQAPQIMDRSLQALSRTKVKAAAAQINVVLERLIDLDEVKWLKPLSLAALFPAIQIHLIESTSSAAPLSRRFSSHKLQLCMMVLLELRDNYWGAEVAYRLFEQAEAMLNGRTEHIPTKSIDRSDSTGDKLGSQITSLPLLTPGSSCLDTSQLRSPETLQQTVSDDYSLDPENLFSDEFALGSMFSTDTYDAFDKASVLETVCGDYLLDYDLHIPEFEEFDFTTTS